LTRRAGGPGAPPPGAPRRPAPPRGAARRDHILDAALRVAGRLGPDALTHRRVAEAAGLPLAATTYWFASKDELLAETYRRAAERDIARLEELGARLSPERLAVRRDLPAALARLVTDELAGDRTGLVASYALWLEAARRPELREVSRAWTEAYVRVAAGLLATAGARDPELDARIVVAALDGLSLDALVTDDPDSGRTVRGALERLLGALLTPGSASGAA
jgi:DNA-binding transcriptional regulator YbjK